MSSEYATQRPARVAGGGSSVAGCFSFLICQGDMEEILKDLVLSLENSPLHVG